MPLSRAMWTHGHAIRIETPDRLQSVWRAGFFVRLIGKPSQNVWVHYSIPTPVIVKDNRLSIDSVMVRCRSVPKKDAWIAAVHVYDGETKIAAHNELSEKSADWSFQRYDVPGNPDVKWGVGISINIRFTDLIFPNIPLRELESRPDIGNWNFVDPLGGTNEGRVTESSSREPQQHYGIEISSVGCDFGS